MCWGLGNLQGHKFKWKQERTEAIERRCSMLSLSRISVYLLISLNLRWCYVIHWLRQDKAHFDSLIPSNFYKFVLYVKTFSSMWNRRPQLTEKGSLAPGERRNISSEISNYDFWLQIVSEIIQNRKLAKLLYFDVNVALFKCSKGFEWDSRFISSFMFFREVWKLQLFGRVAYHREK